MSKAAFASVAVLAGALGCQTLLDLTPGRLRGEGGGGEPGTSVSSGGDGGDGGGGGSACNPEACPQPDSRCQEVYCSEQGSCSVKNLDIGESCGEGQECDAEGVCRTARCANGTQDGDETGVDCGGATCPLCPTLLLLATGHSAVFGGEYDVMDDKWDVEIIAEETGFRDPALTVTAEKQGIGLLGRRRAGAPSREIHYVRWSPSGWPTEGTERTGVSSISAPSIDSGSRGALMLYQRQDQSYATLTWTGEGWSEGQAIGQGSRVSDGPSAATLAMQGDLATIAFPDDDSLLGENVLFSQRRENGSWKGVDLAVDDAFLTIPPVMVALDPSPHLLLVYVEKQHLQLRSVYHDGSGWSKPKEIPGAKVQRLEEADFVFSLAALKDNRAILAYRDDGNLHVAHFDGKDWSADNSIRTNISGVPAVARGIGGFDAELVYVSTESGTLWHTRRKDGAWTAVGQIGAVSNIVNVALTSVP